MCFNSFPRVEWLDAQLLVLDATPPTHPVCHKDCILQAELFGALSVV